MSDSSPNWQELAERFGTPLYLYDMDAAVAHLGRLRAALPDCADVYYAMKANPCRGVLEAFKPHVAGLDISSGGEMRLAEKLGFEATKMSFAGPGKSDAELRAALQSKIKALSVESDGELQRLISVAQEAGVRAPITLRLNPQKIPNAFMMKMAGRPSQFGIPEEDVDTPLRRAIDAPEIDLLGFHIYSGTQCLDGKSIIDNMRQTLEIMTSLSEKYDLSPTLANLGGGFGVPYFPGHKELDHQAVARDVGALLQEYSATPRLKHARFILELGRYLIGVFGTYVTRVLEVKEARGKRFAILDGGMNHCFAATGNFGQLVKKNYPVANLSRPTGDEEPHEVVGPLCTPLDSMARALSIPRAERGDLVAFKHCGAYAYTASPLLFLGHDTPPEVVLHDGDYQVARRRLSASDFL